MAKTSERSRFVGRFGRRFGVGALFALFALGLALGSSTPALAQEEPLEAARKAFTAGYAEERAGHYAEALEKFHEVQRVRDTASVRYRIGACLEALGKVDQAREAYLGVGKAARPEDADVVTSAKAKAKELEARLGELSLRVEGDGAAGRATVDGTEFPLTGNGASVFLLPGEHRVTFEPKGEPEVVTPITLEAGRRTVLVLNRRGLRATDAKPVIAPPVEPPPATTSLSTVGVVGVVVGAALVAGAVVSFALRGSAISSIERDCPNNQCPRSKEGDVTSARSRAEALLPIGVGMGVVGGLALGGGVYFLVKPTRAPASATSPAASGMAFAIEVPWH